jgi:hypothetical protein
LLKRGLDFVLVAHVCCNGQKLCVWGFALQCLGRVAEPGLGDVQAGDPSDPIASELEDDGSSDCAASAGNKGDSVSRIVRLALEKKDCDFHPLVLSYSPRKTKTSAHFANGGV